MVLHVLVVETGLLEANVPNRPTLRVTFPSESPESSELPQPAASRLRDTAVQIAAVLLRCKVMGPPGWRADTWSQGSAAAVRTLSRTCGTLWSGSLAGVK
jgi:hypothetical protein